VGTSRSGTGDIFASILAADAVNGVDFHTSVKKASAFIKKCILKSIEMDIPLTDGVCFEEVLTKLK
jgi:pyridoxine kinase